MVEAQGKTKYSVGQKVRVRSDLVIDMSYRGYTFVDSMRKYMGKEVTISKNYESYDRIGYYIEEDDISFTFTDEMFEEIEEVKEEIKAEGESVGILTTPMTSLPVLASLSLIIERVIYSDPATILFYKTASNYEEGYEVAVLKAFRKEIGKLLKKM